MYALTNQHGLRLAITAGRIGFAPAAASSPRDAIELALGFPVLHGAPLPSEVIGAIGPVIGLEVAGLDIELQEPRIWSTPLAIGGVARAVFRVDAEANEWQAGLIPLGMRKPAFPIEVDASLFADSAIEAPELGPDDVTLARRWRLGLDRQERVSAGLLLGDRLAGGRYWERGLIEGLRTAGSPDDPAAPTAALRVRRCANAFAKLDAVVGWSNDDVVAALDAISLPELGLFARAHIAASDPFEDAPGTLPVDAVDGAIAFLLDHQGISGPDLAEVAVRETSGDGVPLTAALVGLAIGRSLIPIRLRDVEEDQSLAAHELDAVDVQVRTRSS